MLRMHQSNSTDPLTWRNIWAMILGSEPPFSHVTSPMAAIPLIYMTAYLTCLAIYKLSEFFVPNIIKIYVLDFVKTMCFISYGFGHGVVRKYYGNFGYVLCVVPLNTITALSLSSGEGNPVGNWKNFLKGQRSFLETFTRIGVQILAGSGAWRLGLFIYNLDFYWNLPETAAALALECKSFLTISVVAGFLLEMTGATYDNWMGYQFLSNNRALDVFLKFINTASVVCFGSHLTGMFMHPSMASAFSFGCGTTPVHHHIIVYWMGPFTGAFLSVQLTKHFNLPSLNSVETTAKTNKKDVKSISNDPDMSKKNRSTKNSKTRHRKAKRE